MPPLAIAKREVTIKSRFPSWFMSPTASPKGPVKTVICCPAWNVPLPLPKYTVTVLLPRFAVTTSSIPSLLKSAAITPHAPGAPLFCDSTKVSDGTVPTTGKYITFEVPPPGLQMSLGVNTVIHPVPLGSIIAAETVAVSFVDDTYVVASCDVPQCEFDATSSTNFD